MIENDRTVRAGDLVSCIPEDKLISTCGIPEEVKCLWEEALLWDASQFQRRSLVPQFPCCWEVRNMPSPNDQLWSLYPSWWKTPTPSACRHQKGASAPSLSLCPSSGLILLCPKVLESKLSLYIILQVISMSPLPVLSVWERLVSK